MILSGIDIAIVFISRKSLQSCFGGTLEKLVFFPQCIMFLQVITLLTTELGINDCEVIGDEMKQCLGGRREGKTSQEIRHTMTQSQLS